MKKQVCFTLDDNIRFLEQLTRDGCKTLDEHPYFALLQTLHRRFGAKFQLNLFYSYAPGGFSLCEVPDVYRDQFAACASWLRLSFHSAYNDPPFPYDGVSASAVLADYDAVQRELLRFAGPQALAVSATLHYVAATRETMCALRARGVRGFVAMAYDAPGREALRYHLTAAQGAALREQGLLYDADTDLWFVHNQLILDRTTLHALPRQLAQLTRRPLVQLMTHEQYFYADDALYQPDFAQKLTLCWETLHAHGYEAVFAQELWPQE